MATAVLNGVNADELIPLLACWRLLNIIWELLELCSRARGVDVGGKRVIGICTVACCWDDGYWFGIGDDVSAKWSDRWDVPSGGTFVKLLDYK